MRFDAYVSLAQGVSDYLSDTGTLEGFVWIPPSEPTPVGKRIPVQVMADFDTPYTMTFSFYEGTLLTFPVETDNIDGWVLLGTDGKVLVALALHNIRIGDKVVIS